MIEKLLIDFNRGIADDIYVNVGIIINVKITFKFQKNFCLQLKTPKDKDIVFKYNLSFEADNKIRKVGGGVAISLCRRNVLV